MEFRRCVDRLYQRCREEHCDWGTKLLQPDLSMTWQLPEILLPPAAMQQLRAPTHLGVQVLLVQHEAQLLVEKPPGPSRCGGALAGASCQLALPPPLI